MDPASDRVKLNSIPDSSPSSSPALCWYLRTSASCPAPASSTAAWGYTYRGKNVPQLVKHESFLLPIDSFRSIWERRREVTAVSRNAKRLELTFPQSSSLVSPSGSRSWGGWRGVQERFLGTGFPPGSLSPTAAHRRTSWKTGKHFPVTKTDELPSDPNPKLWETMIHFLNATTRKYWYV